MNIKEYLLVCLVEECAEVSQCVAKILRFGAKDHYVKKDLNNTQLLVGELNDLLAIIEMLSEEDVIPPNSKSFEQQKDKKEKVKKYMEYSRARGALKDEQSCRCKA